MQYKYEFVTQQWVPEQYIEMDKQRRMEFGMEEIARAIFRDYSYEKREDVGGAPAYKIEIVATSAKKFYRAYYSIERLLAFDAPLQAEVLCILREMEEPDNRRGDLKIVVP